MVSRKMFLISMCVLGFGVTIMTHLIFKPGVAEKRALESYKPMAEKLQSHCSYVTLSLRHSVDDIERPNDTFRKAAQSQIDVFVQSTEQLDMCLDNFENHFDNMKCLISGMHDDAISNDCRRRFVKYYLDNIPERYQKFELLP